jgi:hypothetical protein
MRNFHLRATARGASEVRISFGNTTDAEWQLKQLHIHCAVTFTDPSTLYVYYRHHESTVYDSVLLKTSVSTDAGVLNDIVWSPDVPISLLGKDRLSIVFSGTSSAMQWAYNAVIGQ